MKRLLNTAAYLLLLGIMVTPIGTWLFKEEYEKEDEDLFI